MASVYEVTCPTCVKRVRIVDPPDPTARKWHTYKGRKCRGSDKLDKRTPGAKLVSTDCPKCQLATRVNRDGRLGVHPTKADPCPGSGEQVAKSEPWNYGTRPDGSTYENRW